MQILYSDTSLTPMRVARSSGYIDWASQPSLFKHYPDFLFRYRYESLAALKIAELSRCITSCSDIGGKPYYRLNTPSAGNLHPIELYVQIRGIKGVISGIYHVDAKEKCLVLIREIERDGVEPFVGLSNRFKGMLFIVSIVPFRSEWKYGERAVRYCYIDAGHQTGAILASAHVLGQKATILSDIDTLSLNEHMGFSTQEFSCMAVSVGEETDKSVEPFKSPLIQVAPTDYCESINTFSKYLDHYKYTVTYPPIQSFTENIATIYDRRSVRLFADTMLNREISDYFLQRSSQVSLPLSASVVILKNAAKDPGIYKEGKIQKHGEYADTMSHLLVDQSFIKNAAMVIIFTARKFTAHSMICAGTFAHMLHLEAVNNGIGFTGIGAFYDEKLQLFLETQDPIVYICALGEERS
ncbi:MAG: nitroreductase family protein [Sulfurovum sp.]|nr:nitroreductase family protein [Sulfurovum sp.]